MAIQNLSDESILQLCQNIRQQVEADQRLGDTYRLMGATAKQEAERLRSEIERRGLQLVAIVWE